MTTEGSFKIEELNICMPPIHIVDSPRINGNEDSEVAEYIDKYITCVLLEETKYSGISNLVKKVHIH